MTEGEGRMKVGMLIGSIGVSGGGVPRAVRTLCHALSGIGGISVEVYSLDHSHDEKLDFGPVPVHLAKVSGPASFGYAPDLVSMIERRNPDILHVHGIWMYQSIAARAWHRRTGRPYLVSPHGMLDPWALSSGYWKKKLARLLYEDAHLSGAACLHALCEAEESAIVAAGYRNPVAVLPNGVDPLTPVVGRPAWRQKLPDDARILMFLGRLTPKKGVAELVRAFARAARRNGDWHLVLVGPDEGGYGELVARMASSGADVDRIHLVGSAWGEERNRAFSCADAFILPSVSEGQPLAALEALSMGVPAWLSVQCNILEAFDAGCALPVGTSEDEIVLALEQLFQMPRAELKRMGALGAAFVSENFNWESIAGRYAGLYKRLASSASPRKAIGDSSAAALPSGIA